MEAGVYKLFGAYKLFTRTGWQIGSRLGMLTQTINVCALTGNFPNQIISGVEKIIKNGTYPPLILLAAIPDTEKSSRLYRKLKKSGARMDVNLTPIY